MAVTTKKSLLFLAGGVAAAALVAYTAGAFDPLFRRAPETIAALPEAGNADSKDARLPEAGEPAAPGTPATPAAPEATAPATEPAAPEPEPPATTAPAEVAVVPPSFDVVRVEGDGSIVIAGKAAPGAKVDLLVGSNVIGGATAGTEGNFAAVLDDPLKPGDYQIVLRATAPDNVAAMSVETAVVSIPETPDGQVLALVEEPGKPSQMITLPKPQAPPAAAKPPVEAPAAAEVPAAPTPAAPAPVGAEQQPGEEMQAALPQQAEPAPAAPASPPPAGPAVRVEAVEIDGRKIFVAGTADPGRTVRGYANEILLGDAKASPDGRFLIEADRDLKVGDYIIRVDALEPDGVKVAARAAVPFAREPGETIAAVAPPEPEHAAPAATSPTPEAPAQPPAVAEVPAATPPASPPPATAEAPAPSGEAPAASTPAAPTVEGSPDVAAAQVPQEPAPVAEAPAQPAPLAEAPAAPEPVTESEQPAPPPVAAPAPTPESPATETPAATAEAPAQAPASEQPATVAQDTQPQVEEPAAPAASAETPAAAAPTTGTPSTPPAVAEAPASAPVQAPSAVTQPAAESEPSDEPQTDIAAAPVQQGELPAPPSADGVQEVLAPKLQPVGSAVIIRRGDTLWRISRRVYGRGVRYSTIYLANQDQIEDPDRIWPGQVFKVPEKSADGKAEADYSTLGNRLTTLPEQGDAPAEVQQ